MGRRDRQGAEEICQPMAQAMGLELVEAGIEKEGAYRYLRIYIDKPGGVSLDDCEVFHRAVQPAVEHIDYDFLEVSSPGLDRPLKTQRDFDRHAGQAVTVRLYRPLDGRKELEGTLVALADGELALDTASGPVRVPHKAVALVRPVVSLEGLEDELDEDEDET